MEAFLFLGFLIGMQHALEADHLAAVGAMAAGDKSGPKRLMMRGAAWGLGHTITLFLICSLVLLVGISLSEEMAAAMEFAVGVMLVILGLDVLRRMIKSRLHFHAHDHGDGPHLHAHGHAGASGSHDDDPHQHDHRSGFPVRAMMVGLLHGAAGSAALLALAVATTKSVWIAVLYVALFGVGSIIGMAVLSLVAAWPLGAAEKHAKWLHRGLSVAAGVVAIMLGVSVMLETGPLAAGVL